MQPNLLKSVMVKKGITAKELTKKMDISLSAFYHKMAGTVQFTLAEINQINDFLGLSRSELLDIFFSKKVS